MVSNLVVLLLLIAPYLRLCADAYELVYIQLVSVVLVVLVVEYGVGES